MGKRPPGRFKRAFESSVWRGNREVTTGLTGRIPNFSEPRAGSGWPVPSRRTLTPGIQALRSLVWVHLARARGGPCHLAGRSLRASCPPLARGKPSSAILAALGFPTPARLARATPREPVFRPRPHRSPPARAGGTAGRWAAQLLMTTRRSPPTRPKCPPNPKPWGLEPPDGGPLGRPPPDDHPTFTTNPPNPLPYPRNCSR